MEIFKEEDLEEFRNNKIAVHCETEELAKEFLGLCYDEDMDFVCGTVDDGFWDVYEYETCYNFEYGNLMYADKPFYLEEGCIVKEFKGFDKCEDKKTLLEYFMELHGLEEGEEFAINYVGRYRVIQSEIEELNDYSGEWECSFVPFVNLDMLGITKALWKPKRNEQYYYINFYIRKPIICSWWVGNSSEEILFERGLMFKTEEEAEKRLEEIMGLNKQ